MRFPLWSPIELRKLQGALLSRQGASFLETLGRPTGPPGQPPGASSNWQYRPMAVSLLEISGRAS